MKGPGRNAPCPCGRGRKYKHCCLGSSPPDFDEAMEINAWRRSRTAQAIRSLRRLLVKADWDGAEALCDRLLDDFPGEPVADMARAGVRQAQGRFEEEAELSERAALACLRMGGAPNEELAFDLLEAACVARARAGCAGAPPVGPEPLPPGHDDLDGWCVKSIGIIPPGP